LGFLVSPSGQLASSILKIFAGSRRAQIKKSPCLRKTWEHRCLKRTSCETAW